MALTPHGVLRCVRKSAHIWTSQRLPHWTLGLLMAVCYQHQYRTSTEARIQSPRLGDWAAKRAVITRLSPSGSAANQRADQRSTRPAARTPFQGYRGACLEVAGHRALYSQNAVISFDIAGLKFGIEKEQETKGEYLARPFTCRWTACVPEKGANRWLCTVVGTRHLDRTGAPVSYQ